MYKAKIEGKAEVLTRDEVIDKDPRALIEFYESHLKLTKTGSRQ
jgi:hypothetical protein